MVFQPEETNILDEKRERMTISKETGRSIDLIHY